MSSLTFLGAAGTVTGSKHLLQVNGRRILVDCGLFQGLKELRLRNWEPFAVDPASIDAVILTHAHLDHCGYLPRLVAGGYQGRIFCTPGTKDLCSLVLPDSAHLQEEDARQANRHAYTKHSPALPLYTSVDAARALDRLQPVGYDRPVPLVPEHSDTSDTSDTSEVSDTVEFVNAGHLLGSAYARVRVNNQEIVFGGDLGRYHRPILPDPSPIRTADYLLLESTYGDRLHEPDDDGARLAQIVNDTAARGGKLIIPSFAIGRVEEVLYWLKKLEDAKRIPVLPVYIDSPMAGSALKFYAERANELDPVSRFATTRMTVVSSVQQSKDVTASHKPAIVISSSGMATGGRVLHHLAAALPRDNNTVLFVGYQAAGTRGRALCDGAKELKLLGRVIPVAARVERIDSMSAHGDANEIMRWLSSFERPPRTTFLVHGEPTALDALAARIRAELHWTVHIAAHRERVELD
ncbi:MAG TPA: MBL fold metallo-hydrolase [Vicinamibacterales bacterium]|nr:MBL fold metallo-hydrolase [Vicinamibacterales bacterium]